MSRADGTLDLRVGIEGKVVVAGLLVSSQAALHIHGQARAVKTGAVAAEQLCHRDHHSAAIGQTLGAGLDGALAHGGGAHQPGPA